MQLRSEANPLMDLSISRFLACFGGNNGCPTFLNHISEKIKIMVHLVKTDSNSGTAWTAHQRRRSKENITLASIKNYAQQIYSNFYNYIHKTSNFIRWSRIISNQNKPVESLRTFNLQVCNIKEMISWSKK